ncbi:MAG TPA: DUF6152 family protein [Gammaproteobacteria bacterium]
MKTRTLSALFAGLVLAAGTAWAHHNMSAMFDFNQVVKRTGTLAELDWRNPHIYMLVDVEDAGKVERWSFEGPPPGFFRDRNVDRPAFEASKGKSVTVEASRARNGSASGLIRQVTLNDGTVVSACPQNC